MELAIHMENRHTGEKRIRKIIGKNASEHEKVNDFYYGSNWIWTGTEPFSNVSDKIKHIGRGYYKMKLED